MYRKKIWILTLLIALLFNLLTPIGTTHAAGLNSLLSTLATQTTPAESSTGVLEQLFNLLFGKLLGLNSKTVSQNSTIKTESITTTPSTTSKPALPTLGDDILRGKIIVLDPGHGGSNPGAVANGDRESDNNLAVGLELREKLQQAGAKVVMTRDSDRTVAPEGKTLGQELQARVDIAEENNADIFVSLHSNENQDSSIIGAETFFEKNKNPRLAQTVQDALIQETNSTDKGISPENFYVLRNTTMPSILVEMGFVSNPAEAARLLTSDYRNQIAQGIFTGIEYYFQNS